MSETILQHLDEHGVLLVTFNRPTKKNAFNDEQWDAASAALRSARHDPHVAVVVVTGAGNDFSAGVDLSSFGQAPARTDGYPSAYHAFMGELIEFDKPLLAAAKGVGVGIGCTLLFHCDVAYVGESVRLRMPFVALGLVPEAASSLMLPALVGPRVAGELLLTAEWIDAAKAVDLGIASRMYPDAELLEATLARARDMAQFAVGSLQATKRTILATRYAAMKAALEVEDREMMGQVGSPENMEALQAFMEKRKPDFRKLRSQGQPQ